MFDLFTNCHCKTFNLKQYIYIVNIAAKEKSFFKRKGEQSSRKAVICGQQGQL